MLNTRRDLFLKSLFEKKKNRLCLQRCWRERTTRPRFEHGSRPKASTTRHRSGPAARPNRTDRRTWRRVLHCGGRSRLVRVRVLGISSPGMTNTRVFLSRSSDRDVSIFHDDALVLARRIAITCSRRRSISRNIFKNTSTRGGNCRIIDASSLYRMFYNTCYLVDRLSRAHNTRNGVFKGTFALKTVRFIESVYLREKTFEPLPSRR